MTEAPSFTTPQVAEIVELPQRKLLSFLERGYVQPSVRQADGHGSRRLWNFEDIIRCTVIKRLLALSVGTIRDLAKMLEDDGNIVQHAVWFIPLDDVSKTQIVTEYIPLDDPDRGEDPYSQLDWELRAKHPVNVIIDFSSVHAWAKTRMIEREGMKTDATPVKSPPRSGDAGAATHPRGDTMYRTQEADTYIGDGVYLKFEPGCVWLLTDRQVRGHTHTESICLDWSMLTSLNDLTAQFVEAQVQAREEDTTT